MSKYLVALGVILGVLIVATSFSYAAMADANNVKEIHKDATVGCTVCHPEGDFKSMNAYGQAYKDGGRNVEAVTALDAQDADGDGVINADEINAGTNPGDPASK